MENNYSTAKICPYEQQSVEYVDEEPVDKLHCNLALEPGRSSPSVRSFHLHIIVIFLLVILVYKTIIELLDRIDQNFS
jgi:hypothetical protein